MSIRGAEHTTGPDELGESMAPSARHRVRTEPRETAQDSRGPRRHAAGGERQQSAPDGRQLSPTKVPLPNRAPSSDVQPNRRQGTLSAASGADRAAEDPAATL